jgi:sugar/nucleoside kinase (ribokinase family)
VHAASYFLQPRLAAGLPRLLVDAAAGGASTSLDTNDDPSGRWQLAPGLLAACTFLFPNEAEALALARAQGARASDDPSDGLHKALEILIAAGPVPVVKRGRQGAVARTGADVITARGPEVVPVDTVGAGDGFDAGFLAGWLASEELSQALAWGCACGALSTRAAGGTAAQADPDEAAALAARVEVGAEPLTSV